MREVISKIIRILSLVSLVLIGYTIGTLHGYNLGVVSIGTVVGPALTRCVETLGGSFGRVGQ